MVGGGNVGRGVVIGEGDASRVQSQNIVANPLPREAQAESEGQGASPIGPVEPPKNKSFNPPHPIFLSPTPPSPHYFTLSTSPHQSQL